MREAEDDGDGARRGADIFDVTVFIENDRMAIRFMWISFVLLLVLGVTLFLAAHQTWIPLDDALSRAAGMLAGVCMTGVGAVPFTQIRNRMERIRLLEKIQRDYALLRRAAEPGDEDLAFLQDQIRGLYGQRLAA